MARLVSRHGGASLVGLTLLFGCGGRSDSLLDDFSDVTSQGGFGAQTTTFAKGGSAVASGGTYAAGGMVPASGGYTTAYTNGSSESCCVAHTSASCGNPKTTQCVCASMPQCCDKSWTADCVTAVGKLACGSEICIFPAGGATSTGGSSSKGGASSKAGSSAVGATTARGGSTSTGGSTFTSTKPSTGGSGGSIATTSGGAAPKGPCCSINKSAGCNDNLIELCVCRMDAVCCTSGWDDVCVTQVDKFGCGTCAAGGATSVGGSTGAGGTSWSSVATSTNGGTIATGGTLVATDGGSIATAGFPSSGGTPGSGGSIASGGVVATGGAITVPAKMIDDLEDGDGNIYPIDGRQGYWYTYNDNTMDGIQQPTWGARIMNALPITDRPSSKFAAWTAGSGFTDWGAGIGVYLIAASAYYDASRYRGIVFWARVDAATSTVVRFDVTDIQTEAGSGYCANCWNYFGRTITMSTDWRRYSYLWSDMTQQSGWGDQFPKIMPTAIRALRFSAPSSTTFSIYVDEVAFIP